MVCGKADEFLIVVSNFWTGFSAALYYSSLVDVDVWRETCSHRSIYVYKPSIRELFILIQESLIDDVLK